MFSIRIGARYLNVSRQFQRLSKNVKRAYRASGSLREEVAKDIGDNCEGALRSQVSQGGQKNVTVRFDQGIKDAFKLADEKLLGLRREAETGFKTVNENLGIMRKDIDRRFSEVKESASILRTDMNSGFEKANKATSTLRSDMNSGFEKTNEATSTLRSDMNSGFEKTNESTSTLRSDMKEATSTLRSDMKEATSTLRSDMKEGFQRIDSRMYDSRKWFVNTILATVGTAIAFWAYQENRNSSFAPQADSHANEPLNDGSISNTTEKISLPKP